MSHNKETGKYIGILRHRFESMLNKLNIKYCNFEIYGWPDIRNLTYEINLVINIDNKFLKRHHISRDKLVDCDYKNLFKQIRPELEQIREEQLILELSGIK